MGCCSSNQVGEIQSQKNSNSNISTSRASRVSNGSFILGSVSKQTDYKKKYEYISTIGNGAFGKVRLYRDRKIKSLKYAIKTIKKDIFNVHSIESIIREIELGGYTYTFCKLNDNILLSGCDSKIIQWKITQNNLSLISQKENVHQSSVIEIIKFGNSIVTCSCDKSIKIW